MSNAYGCDGMTSADCERAMGLHRDERIDSIDIDPVERAEPEAAARRSNAAIAAADPQARADLTTWDANARERVVRWLEQQGGDAVARIAHFLMREETQHADGLTSCAHQLAKQLRDDYIQSRAHQLADAQLAAEDNAKWRADHACQECDGGFLDIGLKNGRPVLCNVCHGYGAVAA